MQAILQPEQLTRVFITGERWSKTELSLMDADIEQQISPSSPALQMPIVNFVRNKFPKQQT